MNCTAKFAPHYIHHLIGILLLVSYLFLPLHTRGQTKSFAEELVAKLQSEDSIIMFLGTYSTHDLVDDDSGVIWSNTLKNYLSSKGYNKLDEDGRVIIDRPIIFNAKIDYFFLGDLHFKGTVGGSIETKSTEIQNIMCDDFFSLEYRAHEGNERRNMLVTNSSFTGFDIFENNANAFLSLLDNIFNAPKYELYGRFQAFSVKGKYSAITFQENQFKAVKSIKENGQLNEVAHCSVGKVEMVGNSFSSNLLLQNLNITEGIYARDNTFSGMIILENFTLGGNNSDLVWDDFSGNKISVYETDSTFVNGRSSELKSRHATLALIRYYKQFLGIFKSNGDLQSANQSYIEMKDIEGKRLFYEAKASKDFPTYVNWRLNRLVRFYSDHGTNPAKSIIISFYVLIIFGVIYFFFPSDWDKTSKKRMIIDYKRLVTRGKSGYVRGFFRLLVGFTLSLFNAFTLSINAFTTLGFGNIPTHGVARYLCVLEGFIGWFLLSIFTVTLLNQVLN